MNARFKSLLAAIALIVIASVSYALAHDMDNMDSGTDSGAPARWARWART